MSDTPPNNQLIMYRLDELRTQQTQVLEKIDEFMGQFSAHVKDDAIIADRLARAEASSKERPGLWIAIVGAATGVIAIIVSWVK
jgi:hypothetical protein